MLADRWVSKISVGLKYYFHIIIQAKIFGFCFKLSKILVQCCYQ